MIAGVERALDSGHPSRRGRLLRVPGSEPRRMEVLAGARGGRSVDGDDGGGCRWGKVTVRSA